MICKSTHSLIIANFNFVSFCLVIKFHSFNNACDSTHKIFWSIRPACIHSIDPPLPLSQLSPSQDVESIKCYDRNELIIIWMVRMLFRGHFASRHTLPLDVKRPLSSLMAFREKNHKFFVWKNVPTKKHIFDSWQGIEVQPVSSDCQKSLKAMPISDTSRPWLITVFVPKKKNKKM